jgi:hypothetical protein
MLINIIRYLVPNAQCCYTGDPTTAAEYAERVEWLDPRPQPSWADIEAARPTVEHNQAVAQVQQLRHTAYIAEADPLFFKWQRGEGTEKAWLDKIAEIRNRYPEPT